MKKLIKYAFTFVVLANLGSCKNSSNSVLDEAYKIHEEFREIQKDVLMDIGRIDVLETDANREEIKSIKADYIDLKSDILEVPGYPHIHLEGDEHAHGPSPKLSNEQILEIQKELRARIVSIQQRIEAVNNL